MSTSDTFLTRCIYHRKEGKESYYWWYKNHELIDWHLFSLVGNLGDSSIEQIVVWIPSKIQVIRSRFPSSYVVDSCDHCWLDPFFPSPRQNSGEKRTKRGHREKRATMFVVSSNRASLEWTLARFAFAVKTNCESGRGTVVFLWRGGRSPRRGQLARDWVHSGFSNAQAILSDRGRHRLQTVTKFLRLLLFENLFSRWDFFFFLEI